MEGRIRKLTGAYGIVAVLLALILVAVCYNFEGFFPKQESIIVSKHILRQALD